MDDLVEFWRIASRLKSLPRRGWKQRLDLDKVESVADHSFGVAALALFEGEKRGYDVGNLLQLALIHDLEEAITGDLTPRDKRRLSKSSLSRMRTKAILSIIERLPENSRSHYQGLWQDLRTGQTREARLVKSLDKLEMALQAKEYEKRGIDKRKLADFYRSATRQVSDPVLRRVLKKVVSLD